MNGHPLLFAQLHVSIETAFWVTPHSLLELELRTWSCSWVSTAAFSSFLCFQFCVQCKVTHRRPNLKQQSLPATLVKDPWGVHFLNICQSVLWSLVHHSPLRTWKSYWRMKIFQDGRCYYMGVASSLEYLRVNHFRFLPPHPPQWGFPNDSEVKKLPAVQETKETGVRSLGWEDPLEKTTHSSILAWEIPPTEEPGGL